MIGVTCFVVWFVMSGKASYVLRRATRESARFLLCAAALAMCGSICFFQGYSAWFHAVVVIFTVFLLTIAVLAHWAIRILIVRLLVLPASIAPALSRYLMPNTDCKFLRDTHFQKATYDDKGKIVTGWEEVRIPTQDSSYASDSSFLVLDGALYWERHRTSRWIVFFLGNGAHYEMIMNEAAEMGKALKRNVLVFNYRGVGRSDGLCFREDDLFRDGRACLTYLRRTHSIESEDILLFGHSLGGAVATHLYCCEKDSFRGHLVNDRSFSSLPAVPLSWIGLAKPLRALPGRVRRWLGVLVIIAMREIGWTMHVARELLAASAETQRRVFVTFHQRDEIIDFENASMRSALRSSGPATANCRFLELRSKRSNSPHNMPITMDPRWPDFLDSVRSLIEAGKSDSPSVERKGSCGVSK